MRDRRRETTYSSLSSPASGLEPSILPCNKPHSAIVCEVVVDPVREHDQPVAESDQLDQMDEQPADPGDQAAHPNAERVEHGRAPPNRRHLAFVEVAKRARRLLF